MNKGKGARALKFQGGVIGVTILLLLPTLFLLAGFSRLPITDWSGQIPVYRPAAYYGVVFTALVAGHAFHRACAIASRNPIASPRHGPRLFWLMLVTMGLVSAATIIVSLVVPISLGVDTHYYYFDLLCLGAGALLLTVSSSRALTVGSARLQPGLLDAFASNTNPLVLTSLESATPHSGKGISARASCMSKTWGMAEILCELTVVLGYPTVIVPLFSSDVFSDYGRLAFCLIIHPIVQEMVLMFLRSSVSAFIDLNQWPPYRHAKKQSKAVFEQWVFNQCLCEGTFAIEAIMVLQRRFMLSMMRTPSVTIAAVLLTSVEEGILRFTMVHRDRGLYKLVGPRKQSKAQREVHEIVLLAQSGTSAIIELAAIFIHSVCLYSFLSHRFVLNFGYGSFEGAGVSVIMSYGIILEVLLEIIVYYLVIRFEMEHGAIDPLTFFSFITSNFQLGMMSACFLCATGMALLSFTRIPSVAFCTKKEPCSCLERAYSNWEIYRDICEACVNTSTAAMPCANVSTTASDRFDAVTSVDEDILPMVTAAIAAFVATAAIIYVSASRVRWRKNLRQIKTAKMARCVSERENADLKLKIKANEEHVQDLSVELSLLRPTLSEPDQILMHKLMAPLIDDLSSFRVANEEIWLLSHLGRGASSDVWKVTVRNEICAAKRFRIRNSQSLFSFRDECQLMMRIQHQLGGHPNIVGMRFCSWNHELSLITEYAEGGSLDIALRIVNATENSATLNELTWNGVLGHLAADIARGMDCLHSLAVAHRDLKTENILVHYTTTAERTTGSLSAPSFWKARICDFGSTTMRPKETMSVVGSPLFIAPEILTNSVPVDHHAADIFAFAITLVDIASTVGHEDGIKVEHHGLKDFFAAVTAGWRPRVPSLVPKDIVHLITKCWASEPSERPRFSAILASLECRLSGIVAISDPELVLSRVIDVKELPPPPPNLGPTIATSLTLDSIGNVIGWSPRLEAITGRKWAEVSGTHFSAVCSEEGVGMGLRKFLTRALSSGKVGVQILETCKANFLRTEAECPMSPVLVEFYVCFIVSAQNQQTEPAVAFVGRDHADTVLMAQQRHLLMSVLSHELHTPLSSILLNLELFIDFAAEDAAPLSENLHHYNPKNTLVKNAFRSAKLLSVLVETVLDEARDQRGTLGHVINIKSFDVKEAALEVCDLLSFQSDAKGLFLGVTCEESVPAAIRGDPTRVRQILINLTGNAVKFTREGGVKISISTVSAASAHASALRLGPSRHCGFGDYADFYKTLQVNPSDIIAPSEGMTKTWHGPQDTLPIHRPVQQHVKIEVTDTGCGIDASSIRHIFQNFASSRTGNNMQGLGLGLPICYKLAAVMGGTIGVRSNVGQGSVFYFTIPLHDETRSCLVEGSNCLGNLDKAETYSNLALPSKTHNSTSPTISSPAITSTSGNSRVGSLNSKDCEHATPIRVLLAEDDLFCSKAQMFVLRRLGCDAKCFANGQLLFSHFVEEHQKADLIILDSHMPVLGGHDTARKIRAYEAKSGVLNGVCILGCTAGGIEDEQVKCAAVGMSGQFKMILVIH